MHARKRPFTFATDKSPLVVFRCKDNGLQGHLMRSLNTTSRETDSSALDFLRFMRIKPTFQKSYLVRFKRGDDIQTTEVVETTEEEIRTLIVTTFKKRLLYPSAMRYSTQQTAVQLVELDYIAKQRRFLNFIYTRKGKDEEIRLALIENLSPREARIELEKAINSKY